MTYSPIRQENTGRKVLSNKKHTAPVFTKKENATLNQRIEILTVTGTMPMGRISQKLRNTLIQSTQTSRSSNLWSLHG